MSVAETKYEPAVLNTGLTRGEDFSLAFVFLGPDDAVVDITGADSAAITLKTATGTVALISNLVKGLTIDAVDLGEEVSPIGLHWTIDRADTAQLPVGILKMTVWLTLDGLRKQYIKGSFTVEA